MIAVASNRVDKSRDNIYQWSKQDNDIIWMDYMTQFDKPNSSSGNDKRIQESAYKICKPNPR